MNTESKLRIACVVGTRPEIIKVWPVVFALRKSSVLEPFIISSGQHRDLAALSCETLRFSFDDDLGLMQEDQNPIDFLSLFMPQLQLRLSRINPAAVLVQGDTTTALGGALCAHHLKLKLGHIEAGLRTRNLLSPFPEEMNRCVISRMATFNFCPTAIAERNLIEETAPGERFVVGNTVVDSALYVKAAVDRKDLPVNPLVEQVLSSYQAVVFVTGHRRENFDLPLNNLCCTLKKLVERNPAVAVLFPVHPNPHVKAPVYSSLGATERIYLVDPIDYASSISAIARSTLIISDSGGIQEEAPSFGTPVIVTRQITERPEGLSAGTSVLCGLDNPEVLLTTAEELLSAGKKHSVPNPFGDGQAAERIVKILEERLADRQQV